MSHELRTPLNSILGFSEVLRDKLFGDLNEKQIEYTSHIYSSGKHLLDIINDILDMSKIEAGQMNLDLSLFSLVELIRDSITIVRERALKNRLDIVFNTDDKEGIQIEADRRKVKQVLFNLMSNAIKFTPNGGTITIGVKTYSQTKVNPKRGLPGRTRMCRAFCI